MPFTNRREYLFLYTVKDANPNGNPLEENHPRYDEDTQQALASDVRIKRTIRDEWLREGKNVLIDGEAKSLKTRFEELKKLTGQENAEDVLHECLDTRLFGVTFALGNKEAFSWVGPVQFKWARSLHAATFEFIQGTSAFATEGRDGGDKQQRSFRNEYKVPFALMAVYGIANQHAAKVTGAEDSDLEALVEGFWHGTDNLITRSKMEHKVRLVLEVTYKSGFNGKVGGLDEKVRLLASDGHTMTQDEEKAIRDLGQVVLDVSEIGKALEGKKADIEKIRWIQDSQLNVQALEELKKLRVVEIEVR